MGFDEAMLRTAASDGIATLRLYTWDGPWLSLGYAQRRIEAERMAACEQAGVGIVRRTTGGRAVLHGNDLTYSLAAPEAMLRPGLRNSCDEEEALCCSMGRYVWGQIRLRQLSPVALTPT
jgi:lipoate-protein ligase A